MPRSLPKALLLAAALLSLSACQHKVAVQPPVNEWLHDTGRFEQARQQSAELHSWRYTAKVAISTPQLREQANLVWQFRDQSNNVRLFGPLGAGAVKVDFDQYGVQLSDNKGVLYRGDSAAQLLQQITGWPIPVEALSYWLFVQPLPEHGFRYQLDELGDVALIEQSGWQIAYSDFRDYGQSHRLPRKLTARKPLGDDTIMVKLVTKGWQW